MSSSILVPILACLLALLAFAPRTEPQQQTCARWAHQTALDGTGKTLWIQGGRRRLQAGQSDQTWVNTLLSLHLDSDWSAASAPLTVEQENQPNPPAVALGGLYSDVQGEHLYLMGGQFSDTPVVTPSAPDVWTYDVAAKSWSEASTTGQSVRRGAEGAPAIVAGHGSSGNALAVIGFGHIDYNSDPSWSINTPRAYLDSLVTLDLGSLALGNSSGTSSSATTGTGNSTTQAAPAPRADSTLTYVPGMGTNKQGILVSIGGGTDSQLLSNDILDVYDLGAQGWARQPTQGNSLGARVNHCAVRGSAQVNGVLQHHIIAFGGQNLDQSEAYSDIVMLTIPSFTWTNLGSLPGGPSARAGHTCDLVGSQMIVIGGWLGASLPCDASAVSVLDTSTGTWSANYRAATIFTTPSMAGNITGGIGQAVKDDPATSSSPSTTVGASGAGSAADSSTGSNIGTSGGGATGSDGNGLPAAGSGNGNSGGGGGTGNPNGEMQSPGDGSGSNKASTIGAIVGGIAAVAALALAALLLRKWRRRRNERAGGIHRRLLSDAHSIASDDASIFSDASSLVGMPYSGMVDAPEMAALAGPVHNPARVYPSALPPRLPRGAAGHRAPGVSSSSGHGEYARVSLEDSIPSSSNYLASGSSVDHRLYTPSSHSSSSHPHGAYGPDRSVPSSSNTSSSTDLRQAVAWYTSSHEPTPESQPTSFMPTAASGSSSTHGISAVKPAGPRPMLAVRTELAPHRTEPIDPFSDASAVDGHDALSRASTATTNKTRSSGLERNMRDFEASYEAASPRMTKRPTLVIANPSSSDGASL